MMEQTEDGFVFDDHRVGHSPHDRAQRWSLTRFSQAAFVFGQDDETAEQTARPTKRRKVFKKNAMIEAKQNDSRLVSEFVPLFNGAEKPELVELRQRQFAASWATINARIQVRPRL